MKFKDFLLRKKEGMKGAAEFFEKKGFYIVLVLCIAVVGATAVFVTTRNTGLLEEEYQAEDTLPGEFAGDISIDEEESATVQSSISENPGMPQITKVEKVNPDSSPEKKESPAGNKPEKAVVMISDNGSGEAENTALKDSGSKAKEAPGTEQKPEAGKVDFINPVFGEITFDYSMDKLAYSKTLGDWRTHSGIDIASDRGTAVKAVADGFVSEIKKDPRFGITVIIDHQNGYKSLYANLAGDDMVTVNQKIKQGDAIGSIGNTALFECAEAPHLHFEVTFNGILKDPKELLPKK